MSKIVLGGGLSGLSAAYYLTKKNPKEALTLIEASSRTGGWIKSNVQKDGTIFEQGPRTIRPRGHAGANTLQLIEELNLADQIIPITSNHPAAKNRMIYANNSLHLLPSSLLGLFKKQEPFSKPLIMHLLNDLKVDKKPLEDDSIYDFVERRFGKEVADYLISPMICGICAGNAHEISVNFLMEKLFQYEQEHGSIAKGALKRIFVREKKITRLSQLAERAKNEKWNIYSFAQGCETLPLALRNSLLDSSVDFKLNVKCTRLQFDNNKVTVQLNNDEVIVADHLISAIPSDALAPLLKKQHPFLGDALTELNKNVSVAVVNLQFKQNILKNEAFGFLVPPKERLPILGVIFDSCCFPKTKGTVLTVMMGGYWFQQHFGTQPSEDTILNIAENQIKQILKTDQNPDKYKVNILHQCLPQYIVGHNSTLSKINTYIKTQQLPISLCGASYHGVGINDVILSAKNVVNELN